MAIEQAKVYVEDLQRGMFVSRLDRPWTRTPFALQGFYIRDLEEIRQLQKYCRYVYVDVVKTVGDAGVKLRRMTRSTAAAEKPRGVRSERGPVAPALIPCRPVQVQRDAYPEPLPARKEAAKADKLYREISEGMASVMSQAGKRAELPLKKMQGAMEQLVDSMLRSPDASAWLARLQEKDDHTYRHSIRASIWSVLFGRHIGLRRQDLIRLGLATLLKDVGKLLLDDDILQTVDRSPRQELEYRKFVGYSVDLLSREPQLDPEVVKIVQCHRERHDGSGYPAGLRGDKIPVLARMCGVVTFYDEATNPRGASFPVAPSRAVAELYDLRGVCYQEQLVVEFIQAIGLYPTGTQVELSTGEVAVVLEQTYRRRLKPKVMVVLDRDKQLLPQPRVLDLAADDDRKERLVERGKLTPGDKISIVKDLEPSRFPQVDVASVRDAYLFSRNRLPAFLSRVIGR
ncbi:Cyclic di-GMP phosphodiesterase response regulator RpfG [Microbulbifer aggregans]|uniref:Cyclic di-GMP phosphodiesterase response regulator RpfG n=1 Tax=Microbulbifer aggregans TaxID=1769779 RepID=A0A1C9W665_9GAMM|nr:HD-GYP domain-containing protein [Microbulbifer aggregans]AOS96630.1 Cyclic di-GMP phosphodiesterase response regulator RpfG [Microbulbifer aggregans]